MKRITGCIIFILMVSLVQAQEPDAKALQETARGFSRQGDYFNAVVVLNKAIEKDPKNLELLNELAFNYYMQRDYTKALETAKTLPDRPDADVTTYQILGMIYKAIEERKECEKLYKQGLKKFPASGVLYNEYGEMLWTKQNYEAVKYWEKGIELDPNYAPNYYNAAKHYYFTRDKVWAIIYGEIFVNLESYSKRTAEIKKILLDSYKKLFSDVDISKDQDIKNSFVSAYLESIKKQSNMVSMGITPESLTILRTRFILDWYEVNASKFPCRLFDYHKQLLKEGMFDAYNQWIFGAAKDVSVFQAWTNTHPDDYNRFTNFQKGRVFKLPNLQYLQTPVKL